MKTKSLLLILCLFTSVYAIKSQVLVKATHPEIKEDKPRYTNANQESINKNKNLLEGFDEKEVIKTLKLKGIREEVFAEVIEGEKVKFIKSKLGTTNFASPAIFDKTISFCTNLGFELQNYTNWQGFEGYANNSSWAPCPSPTNYVTGMFPGLINLASNTYVGALGAATYERMVILTCATCHDTLARDPNSGVYKIPYLAPGGSGVSVRLGNANVGGDSDRLRYELNITPLNPLITLYYSAIFENPTGHAFDEKPFFIVSLTDTLGILLGSVCNAYCFFADASDPNFTILPAGNQYNADPFNDIIFRAWDSIKVDLSPYVGNKIILEFTTGDCALSGHFGYAYVDAKCEQGYLPVIVTLNPNDSILLLDAPNGLSNFQWLDSTYHPILGATNDSFFVLNPYNGQSWNLRFQEPNGCVRYLKYIFDSQISVYAINETSENIQIYPNPAIDEISVSYVLSSQADVCIEIRNTLGEIVYKVDKAKQSRGNQIQRLSIHELKAGIYFISIAIDGKKNTRKISIE